MHDRWSTIGKQTMRYMQRNTGESTQADLCIGIGGC